MSGRSVFVRPARPEDARGVAEVHVATWRAAYAGLMPAAVLDGLSVDERAAKWQGLLAAPRERGWALLVAEDACRVTGFVSTCAAREGGGPDVGEISALYVEPAAWDTGTGRTLHDAALDLLRAAGFISATLRVLEANARGRRFYERQGWRDAGARSIVRLGGADLVHATYERVL